LNICRSSPIRFLHRHAQVAHGADVHGQRHRFHQLGAPLTGSVLGSLQLDQVFQLVALARRRQQLRRQHADYPAPDGDAGAVFAHHRHQGQCRLLKDVTLSTHGLLSVSGDFCYACG
jgi:hypothetical protein